ncbi:hypothetical protein CDAR_525901 [Caerostris darwini]|uniref:Uncharacterized protein n=1 Tax=Caerostris darwini TaxID=1538125 RepID=A0AAV4S1R6_9ARAC|nr:hypothetical protein CDAR_525901 [Caerostris darwini]
MPVTSINSKLVDNGESLLFHALFEENFRSNPDGIWLVIMRFRVFHKSPDFEEVENSWRYLRPDRTSIPRFEQYVMSEILSYPIILTEEDETRLSSACCLLLFAIHPSSSAAEQSG